MRVPVWALEIGEEKHAGPLWAAVRPVVRYYSLGRGRWPVATASQRAAGLVRAAGEREA